MELRLQGLFPLLDTLLLRKYFDMRSLMYFAFISKHLRNLWACHMITFWELCSSSGWLWTWESGLSCAASRHSHAWPKLKCSQLWRWKPWYCLSELSGVMGRWRQGEWEGGLLERPVVNLQTEPLSGSGAGQESSDFTAQLCFSRRRSSTNFLCLRYDLPSWGPLIAKKENYDNLLKTC